MGLKYKIVTSVVCVLKDHKINQNIDFSKKCLQTNGNSERLEWDKENEIIGLKFNFPLLKNVVEKHSLATPILLS